MQASTAHERLQNGRGPAPGGDDPVPQRVDDLDVLRSLARQGIRYLAHRGRLAGFPVDGDRRGLLDDQPLAGDVDQRINRSEVNRHARPQPHESRPQPEMPVRPSQYGFLRPGGEETGLTPGAAG